MQAGVSPARQMRAQHRHELRSLTYVTLDETNGGVVRNLTRKGLAVQVVTAVFPGQQMRVRFELRGPRLMIAAHGEVMWATDSGRCGIRLLDVSPRMTRQVNEWIFGNLLQGLPPYVGPDDSGLATRSFALVAPGIEDDGLMVSAAPVKVIELPLRPEPLAPTHIRDNVPEFLTPAADQLDWLSQPLSGRSLAWTVNVLAVLAALLLFALIFLSVIGEPPQRPFVAAGGATILVAALYWGFFKVFGGGSPGARLARLRELSGKDHEDADGARFR